MKTKKQKNSYPYLHIINNEIKESNNKHPCDNVKNKSQFIKWFSKDLNVDEVNDISDNKQNLFRVYYKNLYYNVFIEHPDGGGKDVSYRSTGKKITIPFHLKAFKKIIKDFQKILVVNIYFPLHKNFSLDYLNRVYLIVDPKEVYQSKVVHNEQKNPSSRWVNLELILKVIKNKNYLINKKRNVYIVHWKKIQWFFDFYLKEEYKKMIYKASNDFINKNINKKDFGKYRKYFRELIIDSRGTKCELINCKINIIELLIASHIKPVNEIIKDSSLKEEEKKQQIQDPFNGFLLCPNHDAIFDKFFITFSKEGKLLFSKILEDNFTSFNLNNNEVMINLSEKNIKYLNFHNKIFKEKGSK